MGFQKTIETLASAFSPMFATNKAVGTLPVPVPQLADPLERGSNGAIAAGVVDISPSGASPSNYGKFIFYGTGTATQTFEAKIIGWQQAQQGVNSVWIPVTLADLLCTLSSTPGPTGSTGPVLATHKMVGTIAVISSLIETNYDLWPADNGIQMIRMDLSGFQRLQLLIGTESSATDGNALFSGF